ncbi:MAG: hypothetical protein OSA88_07320 [Acidimicrobiales bacterium]|nr:hypothetical protein [Acidimicrobiales bacterium]
MVLAVLVVPVVVLVVVLVVLVVPVVVLVVPVVVLVVPVVPVVLVVPVVVLVVLVVVLAALEEALNSDEAESKSGVDVSAKNYSPRSLLRTRLWTRRFLRVRSQSNAVRLRKNLRVI